MGTTSQRMQPDFCQQPVITKCLVLTATPHCTWISILLHLQNNCLWLETFSTKRPTTKWLRQKFFSFTKGTLRLCRLRLKVEVTGRLFPGLDGMALLFPLKRNLM